MIKGIIFDLDDTMVNSEPLHSETWSQLLKEYSHQVNEIPKAMQINQMGMRVLDVVKERALYLNLNDSIETIYKRRICLFLKLAKEKLQLMPGLLSRLKILQKNRYHLAIASSGAKQYVNMVLDQFYIRNYFEVVVTGDDVTKGKPDPETYLSAAEKLYLNPNECLVIEDATKGIQSAKAAGCKCIAIENTNIPKQNLSEADMILASLTDFTLKKIRMFN